MGRLVLRDKNYVEFLKSIKEKIKNAHFSASRAVNRKLTNLYWQIGKEVVERQEKLGWGRAVVERLAKDLMRAFPGTNGFSARNLWEMRLFYSEYKGDPILQQAVAEIPWSHNLLILHMVEGEKAREYYLKGTAELGWSRNVLLNQIKARAFERQAAFKQHNFQKSLPKHLAKQADQAMKDVYMLDFLGIKKPVLEQEVERRMVNAIKDVLLELGYGFSFIGNQYKIKLGEKEYFIDLLFYHRRLKCLVAIELKTGAFLPESAGKMNFYLNILDDFVREEGENPSIGVILCAERDHIEVEYALRGINKPVGVAKYQLTANLPKELIGKLPSAKELKEEILAELEK